MVAGCLSVKNCVREDKAVKFTTLKKDIGSVLYRFLASVILGWSIIVSK